MEQSEVEVVQVTEVRQTPTRLTLGLFDWSTYVLVCLLKSRVARTLTLNWSSQ